MDAFLAQGADGLRVIAVRSVQAAIGAVHDGLAARAPLDDFLQTCLRSGAMPLVAACFATRISYAVALLQRAYGLIVAVTQNAADFEAELRDAAEALDGAVIMDASALAAACELPDRFPTLHGAFDEIEVDEETRFDCMTACSKVRQAPGTVSEVAVARDGRTLRQIDTPDEDLAAHAALASHIVPDQLENILNRIAEAVARRSPSDEHEREALLRTAGHVAAAEQARRDATLAGLER